MPIDIEMNKKTCKPSEAAVLMMIFMIIYFIIATSTLLGFCLYYITTLLSSLKNSLHLIRSLTRMVGF